MIRKTYHLRKKEVSRKWHLIDAKGKILGRLSARVASVLMGKNKSTYSPHIDTGDSVVVFNCEKIKVTGRKMKQKMYRKHSGYPGGFREIPFERMLNEKPEQIIRHAVSGMLPDNRLKKNRLKRLRVFVGETNPFIEKIRLLVNK